MGWAFRNADKRTELERLAADAEALFLAMPPEHQAKVHETIAAIAAAAEGLKVLPEQMGTVLFKIVMRFFQERVPVGRVPTVRAQIEALTKGAPTMLGPYRADIEAAVATEAA